MKRASGIGALPPVREGGLQEAIYTTLREAITSGTLAPGERLRQLDLARQFGTSQAPVREALQRLTQEGLAVSLPNRGTAVARLSVDEIEEVYVLRAELESLAVRRFIQHATRTDLQKLRRAVKAMQTASRREDQVSFVEADARFHRIICEGSGSALLLQLWMPVDSRVRGMMSVANALFERGLPFVADMHVPILAAIEERDAARADALIREHMHRVWDEIAGKLREEVVPDGHDEVTEPPTPRPRAAARTRPAEVRRSS